MGRRALNYAVGQMRREQAREAVTGLDARCADPACRHELGYHRFVTFTLPTPCQVDGCRCGDFHKEPPVLNPHDPFSGLPEPDAPEPLPLTASQFVDGLDEPETPVAPMSSLREILDGAAAADLARVSRPVGAADPDEALTPVRFPVLQSGASSVALGELQDPARRVAEIVEALEPVLAPPPVVRDLEALVTKANALHIVDADSYAAGCALYEQLAANEKGVEESIGPVVAFFHRPWKALCEFRARFAKPVAEAKKRLSDDCGAWKLAADKAAAAQAQRDADAAAEAERVRLKEIAEAATSAAAAAPAGSPVRDVLEQTATQAVEQAKHVIAMPTSHVKASTPATTTNGRKTYVAALEDEDAFYKALLEDKTRRVAAPIDWSYLNRQAKDLGQELGNRFPGIVAREKGGLSASGKR